MPYFQKYFVVEDQCDITASSNFCAPNHFDIYIGPPTKDNEYTKNKHGKWIVNNPTPNPTIIRTIEYQFSWPLEGWPYCPKTTDQIKYAIGQGSYLTALKTTGKELLPIEQYPVNTTAFYNQFSEQSKPVVFCDPSATSLCNSPYVDNSGGPTGKLACPKDKPQATCGSDKGNCNKGCNGLGFLCNDYDKQVCCPNNPCNS